MSVYSILLAGHVVICLAVIGVVLLQHGKGADAGAAFGSGASGTVFGSRGSASFLSKLTALLAAGFFGTSLVLAMMTGSFDDVRSVMEDDASTPAPTAEERVPQAPAGGEGSDGTAPAPAPSE